MLNSYEERTGRVLNFHYRIILFLQERMSHDAAAAVVFWLNAHVHMQLQEKPTGKLKVTSTKNWHRCR